MISNCTALFIFPFSIDAQQNPVDSLKSVLEKTQIDTVKVNTLNELSNLLRGRDNEQALIYAQEALSLGKEIDFKKESDRFGRVLFNTRKKKDFYLSDKTF